MNAHRKRGFTLIELLVVIAIIAILAAILFPVFAQAKTAAKKAVMVSNMKQNALAVIMYADGSDDMVPPRAALYFGPTGSKTYPSDGYTWESMVMPYTKSYAMFMCTEDPKPKYTSPYGSVRRALAAAGNVFISQPSGRGGTTRPSRTLGGLPQVADTIMLGIRFMNHRTTANYFTSVDWAKEAMFENTRVTKMPASTKEDRAQYGQVENIYQDGSIFAMCDGHAVYKKANGYPTVDNYGYPVGILFPGYEQRAAWWVKSTGYPHWDSGINCTDATPGDNKDDVALDCAVPGEEFRVK